MGDLFDWALSMATGEAKWHASTPSSWDEECAQFFTALTRFDDYLTSGKPFHYDLTRTVQGPIADP